MRNLHMFMTSRKIPNLSNTKLNVHFGSTQFDIQVAWNWIDMIVAYNYLTFVKSNEVHTDNQLCRIRCCSS